MLGHRNTPRKGLAPENSDKSEANKKIVYREKTKEFRPLCLEEGEYNIFNKT